MSRSIEIIPEIRDEIVKAGASDIFKCYQCGKCFSACPWYHVEKIEFPNYRFPQAAKLGTIGSSEDKDDIAKEVKEIFLCVGCESCAVECPRGVGIQDVVLGVRRIFNDYGTLPQELKDAGAKIQSTGNPLGVPAEKRAKWSNELGVKPFTKETEYLYFSCCLPAYDTRLREVAASSAKILQKAGFSFGTLGAKESCCGEAIRRVGSEKVFNATSKANISAFTEAGVKKVIAASPHCYTSFKNEYKELGIDLDVSHQVQVFAQLIDEGKLDLKQEVKKKVVYHDPCTLGRQNEVYDEPRKVLSSIPGLELLEVENFNRKYSLCCGGGGGGLWLDVPNEERLTNVRTQQLADTGAEVIAVACPYCLQMFEDSVKVMNLNIEVKDISELLLEAMGEKVKKEEEKKEEGNTEGHGG
ncbi:(Fe-S)-binding protein, partial [Spirochaetota bacterium]